MDACPADVAGAAQACTPCAARDRPLNPGAAGRLGLERLGRCAVPGRLERLIWRLRAHRERPPGIALLRAYARGSVGAAPTICARELPLDDRMAAMIHGGRPADTRL